jgi:hypothetical protein
MPRFKVPRHRCPGPAPRSIKGAARYFLFLFLILLSTMAQQFTKDILILGDSNVERNILHIGHLYSQLSDSVPARNLEEFSTALTHLPTDKYRIVIFAMLTNIVVGAGNSSPSTDLPTRLRCIEACLKSLFQLIT